MRQSLLKSGYGWCEVVKSPVFEERLRMTSPSTLQLGVLCSGEGTNLQAILDAIANSKLDAVVRVVLVNRADAAARTRAERAGVPVRFLSHREFPTREAYDEALVLCLQEAGAEWVVLAGFLRLVTPTFLDAFPDRVVNVHPALLPAFPGLDAQMQALSYGTTVTGCTVHFVDAGTDTGPILAQAIVPVREDDTRAALAGRLARSEHSLLVTVLQWLAAGRVRVERRPGQRPRVLVPGVRRVFGAIDDEP